ncbi:MAG: transposase [Desulfobulbaceae bacterium]|nr:transposase [Desulfobulbaceae bacterium]
MEAKKRYDLELLNFTITSNHIHLFLFGGEDRESIFKSMQLVAEMTAQEYNRRIQRKGAFWEDRYHATAVDTDNHLARCLVYIDLNMVRAGVVHHPEGIMKFIIPHQIPAHRKKSTQRFGVLR